MKRTVIVAAIVLSVCIGGPKRGRESFSAEGRSEQIDVQAGQKKTPDPFLPSQLTTKQQRVVNKLLGRLRRARNDQGKQAQVLGEAVAAGPWAVSALLGRIEQDVQPQLKRYRAKLTQQAALVAKQKIGSVKPEEIARLQAVVLGLQTGADFTKETIVAKGDPAMKQLQAIFVINPAEILNASNDLRGQRERLQERGVIWERGAVYLHNLSSGGADKTDEPPSFGKYLRSQEEMAAAMAVPMDAKTRAVLAANARLAAELDPEEAWAIRALNLTRNLLGLPPLTTDLKLCDAARDHSKDMEKEDFFSHTSPVPGKTKPWDRAKRFGTTAAAENIATGQRDGRTVNLSWFHSPGHHKNMLGQYERVGVGRHGALWTELFGR